MPGLIPPEKRAKVSDLNFGQLIKDEKTEA
jgi:hypothetical protein